jgi:hypothetical protein
VSEPDKKPAVLGFNLHSLLGYLLSVVFIAVAPLLMLLRPTAPVLSVLVVLVVTILWVRRTKRFFFWTLQSGLWVLFLAFGASTQGCAHKNKQALEGEEPISAQSLKETPASGLFLLSGASLDPSTVGSYRNCEDVWVSGADGEPFAFRQRRCTSASVTALKAPLDESGESEIVGWVVRDDRAWPRFFGDSDPLPLTTSSGGMLGSRSEAAEHARKEACESWGRWQSLGRAPKDRPCPADAPLFYPVDTVPVEITIGGSLKISSMVIGLHSASGWLIVLWLVFKRALKRSRNRRERQQFLERDG